MAISLYTSTIILVWMSTACLCVLVRDNARIAVSDKWAFYSTYVLIAFSALAEWLGVQLNGNTDYPTWVLTSVKCIDYMLTPMAGGMLVAQMKRNDVIEKILFGVLGANIVLQLVSLLTGWMTVIDDSHYYSHGPLYSVYIAVYVIVLVIIEIEFVLYGRTFRQQNRTSLYIIMLMLIAGILMQELTDKDVRTAYITLTIGAALLFIHYSEFSQISMEDQIEEQKQQMVVDELTGLLNRHAYSDMLKEYSDAPELPANLVVFTIDIDGLKRVNDTLGHEAGDELIRGTADCIRMAFGGVAGRFGRCYRTGGDEFVIVSEMSRQMAKNMTRRLQAQADAWHGELVEDMHLSYGYAVLADDPDMTAEQLIRQSDLAMYDAKAEYYRKTGIERRR